MRSPRHFDFDWLPFLEPRVAQLRGAGHLREVYFGRASAGDTEASARFRFDSFTVVDRFLQFSRNGRDPSALGKRGNAKESNVVFGRGGSQI